MTSCGGGSSGSDSGGGGGGALPGGGTNPDTGLAFLGESNKGGAAQAIKISGVFWGRLVDVFDTDTTTGDRRLLFTNFVIGDNIISDGVTFELERNSITGQETLTILREVDDPENDMVIAQLEANLQPLLVKGITSNEAPPFSAVPRNAAIVVRFDDILDPDTIDETTVKVRVGNPPTTPFEARIFGDPNHGALADFDSSAAGHEFYPTRVIIDTTVSQIEAQTTPIPVNPLGLPEAPITTQANVALVFPTRIEPIVGQVLRLENPTAHPLSFTNNGPVDSSSLTNDVVRGFRSGLAADPDNGFLKDDLRPDIVGVQAVTLANAVPTGQPDEFFVDATFSASGCAVDAAPGDVIQTTTSFVEVLQPVPLAGNTLNGLQVRLLNGTTLSSGAADFLTVFDPTQDLPDCFVRFNPPALTPPTADVRVNAEVIVRFSEPMDPVSLLPFDTFSVAPATTTGLSAFEQQVVGQINSSADLLEFRFSPSLFLRHAQGSSESYIVTLDGEITDLAGNLVQSTLGSTTFTIAPGEPTQDNSGVVLTFDSLDQDGDGFPEVSGNFLVDLNDQLIKARSVDRFSSVIDDQQSMIAGKTVFNMPIQTPLSDNGSKMQTVWRHNDMGFGLFDRSRWDIDVEGLAWAPFNGAVQLDTFSRFGMRLGHSNYLPDEAVDALNLPIWIISGLVTTFENNFLPSVLAAPKVVHDTAKGYSIQPLNAFPSATGRIMVPWPMNEGVPVANHITYTWRDTAARERAAPNGNGADPDEFYIKAGLGVPAAKPYVKGNVPTIGLPLLMEFRCHPDDEAFGQNGLQIALGVNSSSRPFFRAFATGGVDQAGVTQTIDPDNHPIATGGFNPGAGGATTPGGDNSIHFGQADFVVRVSRVHSRWFDSGALTGVDFAAPVIEPAIQPSGTSVTLAFRGASNVLGPFGNANAIGAYGDSDPSALTTGNIAPTFIGANPAWSNSIDSIDGAQFFQFRATLVSNIESLLTPTLSAVGLPYER